MANFDYLITQCIWVESQSHQLGSQAGEDELRTATRTKRQITKPDVSVDLSPALRISMEPVLQSIKALPRKIREYNRKIVEP